MYEIFLLTLITLLTLFLYWLRRRTKPQHSNVSGIVGRF